MKALVVDDDETLRIILAEILEISGFKVEMASNAEKALEFLESDLSFTILITDFYMPRMNGEELIRTILARGFILEKIILISGLAENQEFIQELKNVHPGLRFLLKPFGEKDLISTIFENEFST